MKDRFIAGSVAGLVGAAIQVIYGYAVKATGIADRSFHDFGKVFIMSSAAKGILSETVGIMSNLTNGIFFGIIFAFIIYLTSSKYYLIKGLIYGTILWHIFLGLGTMYKMPAFGKFSPSSSLATLIGSLIYGIVAAYILKILDNKTSLL